ncbi:transposase [Burkholderia ubonensis]|uniref:transposase n=1 Tax=Burkholderia ubonensis TaxID=101571 RepID=UPI001E4E8060|nr:transposase [Burkholderia ubonensis]
MIHDQPATRWHDQIAGYIQEKGLHAFHNKYGYGKRPLVEAQISRIKHCIGSPLLTCRFESPQREGVIIANLVNQWDGFGKAVCVKTA